MQEKNQAVVGGDLCRRISVSGAVIIQLSGIFRFEADKGKNGAKFNQIFFGMPRTRNTCKQDQLR